ncbi:MAG: glycosyltransferase family 39 protein [Candidatus Acidiferrales bacterium]
MPHDDGMLAQSAERALQGQLPHRDFDEVYTGGLSYLHAAAFKLFGTNLFSLREMLFIFFLLWVPALYFCASRFASPLAAGLATLVGVAWSVPVYPAAMPSWYCLFFATFGIAALFKYIEARATIWLFLAGLCGGLSFLVKSPGIYYIGVVLLFFLFCEQSQARAENEAEASASKPPGKIYPLFLRLSILAFVAALALLIHRLAGLTELYYFMLPGLALGLALLAREARPALRTDGTRFRNLFRMAIPFLAGAVLPVALFLIPYAATHSLGSFYRGVFVAPFMRISMAVFLPPALGDLIALVPSVGLLAFACFSKRGESPYVAAAAAAGLVTVLVAAPYHPIVYQFDWLSAGTMIPVIVVAGALVVLSGRAEWKLDELSRQRMFLILSAAALCSLIAFPYSSATYFCYVAPLVALAALAIVSARSPRPRLLPAMAAVFYAAFMMFMVTPGFALDSMSRWYVPPQLTVPLGLPRAGALRVKPFDAAVYNRVISLVEQKARNGAVYAGPDSPEIYFLAGMQNPSRVIFDGMEDYAHETSRVLAAIDSANPTVIVINRLPAVSTPFPVDLREALAARFPEKRDIGKFEVRWQP